MALVRQSLAQTKQPRSFQLAELAPHWRMSDVNQVDGLRQFG
jgi:hypothetical protein